MGQCVSHKAVSAFQRPVAAHPHRKKVMHNGHMKKSPEYDSNSTRKITHTKGVASSFGFRRRPATAPSLTNNSTAAKRLAQQEIIDRNGNSGDTEALTTNAIPPGRTTPKLAPPKKEANATRINRFGFRQPNANRLNKISDINSRLENKNNNRTAQAPQLRFTLQSTQLPKPQLPVHILDTKTAKTLANNCKKVSSRMYLCENNSNSSKDGSFTEDSGVGSHASSGNGEIDNFHGAELADTSPIHKPRRFDVVLSGLNFDLRDLDESNEPPVPIPSLPSAFQHNHTGFVHNRRFEYEKQLHRRKLSTSSSDGFSDNYVNLDNAPKKFLKTFNNRQMSPYSSDQESWNNGGEAMADDTSYSCSSSDDISTPALALQNFMNASITNKTAPIHEIRSVLLTIEDPKFAAVANKSSGSLLDDETSPVDSLVCSYSESEDLTKLNNDNILAIEKSASNSKDVNEKDGLSSPGSPTNASNSLSLSDGKDYFDDEIADQPALVFDDTITTTEQVSDTTLTLIDITPKPKRKFFGSPLLLRKRSMLNSAASVDTLSPCESIASDDLMMDFDHSQSSGMDDNLGRTDTHRISLSSLEDTPLKPQECKVIDSVWAVCVGNGVMGSPKSTVRPARLLRSRGSTSSGSKPESPCSLDSHINSRNCHSLTRSPLRLARPAVNSHSGYDSDDSIKLDRANHGAMLQDVTQIKTMLIKLRRVLNEQAHEDILKKSDTLNPFDNQSLKNGLFNGLSSESSISLEEDTNSRFEMADLKRQVLFLQGQLEDREQSLQLLHEKMTKLVLDNETVKSAPASTVSSDMALVNAATQTERVRPISAGPSLLQVSPADGSMGSLVSASERKSRSSSTSSYKQNQPSLWRKPGEPPIRHVNYGTSNNLSVKIPKRVKSLTRSPLTPV